MKNQQIIDEINEIFENIIEIRRTIHRNPELSFKEYETSEFIQKRLDSLDVKYDVYDTGVIAHIGNGDRCIALRADMDALPIEEETGLEFSSANPGVMHACGHDMHTAMLLATAEILKKNEDGLKGKIKLVFQPGEETIPGGASILLEKGALDNPAPEAIFGQHINPGEIAGKISIASGPVMASADEVYINVKGKGSHAAQPHIGNDPVLAASHLVQYIQTFLTKFRNPINPGVISITTVHGGSAANIFPDVVKLSGTMRSFDFEWREKIHNLLREKIPVLCSLYNCDAEVEIRKGYPPLINNAETSEKARSLAIDLLGEENVMDFEPKMWAEDFAYYAQKMPGTFWFLGVRPEEMELMPPLHNAKLNPVEDAMKNGIGMFVKVAFDYFK